MSSNSIFVIWLVGVPSFGLLDWYFVQQMRKNLSPGLAQFKGYTDWRLEGRRFALRRDPAAYSERGRKYRRAAIVVECLSIPCLFGGMWVLSLAGSQ
jgi:hypothetical protein